MDFPINTDCEQFISILEEQFTQVNLIMHTKLVSDKF